MFFKNLLRNWDWGDHPPTLLGTIPKFHRFFILKASLIKFSGVTKKNGPVLNLRVWKKHIGQELGTKRRH